MRTIKILSLLPALVVLPLAAQSSQAPAQTANSAGQAAARPAVQKPKETAASIQKQIRALMLRDVRLPSLSPARLTSITDAMQKDFVDFKFPDRLSDLKTFPTPMYLRALAKQLNALLKDPEVEEATGISLQWYNKVGQDFVALYKPLNAIYQARKRMNSLHYASDVREYRKQAEILEKTLKRPIRIPSSQLEQLRDRNIVKRKIARQKQIQLLEQKKRTLQ